MKRLILIFLSVALMAALSTSCTKEDILPSFDESLIIGKWKSGTLFERYDADKTGATWNTADDVTEEEGQNFTWTIEIDQLEQIHIIENGGKVPKIYTITELTASSLKYEDDYGKSKSFTKQ
ncbi:MAG: hypothetical protein IMY72_13140 [Bacteroidetes bacterium]|nr:hypothetical protein [Bacteroidota bacterium]